MTSQLSKVVRINVMSDYLRGHKIEKLNGKWVYSDTKTLTANTNNAHDGCLGELPGIMNACCGHGLADDAYLQYWDGSIINGKQKWVV